MEAVRTCETSVGICQLQTQHPRRGPTLYPLPWKPEVSQITSWWHKPNAITVTNTMRALHWRCQSFVSEDLLAASAQGRVFPMTSARAPRCVGPYHTPVSTAEVLYNTWSFPSKSSCAFMPWIVLRVKIIHLHSYVPHSDRGPCFASIRYPLVLSRRPISCRTQRAIQ
jgi:hypothetical protein